MISDSRGPDATSRGRVRPNGAKPRLDKALPHLLRNLSRPEQLRQNPLAAAHFASAAGISKAERARNAGLSIRRAVDLALEQMPVRERSVVQSYDLDGVPIALVARQLHVSERQAYRDRARALRAVGRRLRSGPVATPAAVVDVAAARICYAEVLEQAGQWIAAAALLESMSAAVESADERSLIHLRLTQLYGVAGKGDRAFEHARAAAHLVASADPPSPLVVSEAELCRALALYFAREFEESGAVARRVIPLLREAARGSASARAVDAEAMARILVFNSYADRAFVSGMSELDEAIAAAESTGLARPGTFVMLYLERAWGSSFREGALSTAVSDCERAAALAVASNLPREFVFAKQRLASIFGLRNEPGRVVATLEPLLPMLRTTCAGDWVTGTLFDLVDAHSSLGDVERARELASEAWRTLSPDNVHMVNFARTVEARAALRSERFSEALVLSRRAAGDFERETDERLYLGCALNLEALALAALGRRDEASHSIGRALEAASDRANPIVLARMQCDAGRLTENRRLTSNARERLRALLT